MAPHIPHVVGKQRHRVDAPDDSDQKEGDDQQHAVDGHHAVTDGACGKAGRKPVDVDKRRAQLEEQERRHPRHTVGPERVGKHKQRGKRVEEKAGAEQADVAQAHVQVPHEVAHGHGAHKPGVAVVAVERQVRVGAAVLEVGVVPRGQEDHHGQDALHHGHHVDVEVQSCFGAEVGVGGTNVAFAQCGRRQLDAKVHERGGGDLVPMGQQVRRGFGWERSGPRKGVVGEIHGVG